MDYTDESVSEIATQYNRAKEALKELNESKRDRNIVLAHIVECYTDAYKAILFLKSAPENVQERLGITGLEKELLIFGNSQAHLQFF